MTIIPRPNRIDQFTGAFSLTKRTRIEYADVFTSDALQVASHLRERMGETHGLALQVVKTKRAAKDAILLGTFDDPLIVRALKASRSRVDHAKLGTEGYVLSVTKDRVVIAALDSHGLFYGAQTFLQTIERRGAALQVPCSRCVDWPLHPFRGAHLYVPPKREIEYFKRLIRYLASCKINKIILELGAAMEFKRHPEINRAWEAFAEKAFKYPWTQTAMANYNTLHTRGKDSIHPHLGGGTYITQDDIRGILRCAREHHIEVIPEVQSPGHAYWLCLAHPEIAEWKDDKYPDTLCPSNPRSYELLFDAMEEVIEVFEPKWISTGDDEYYFYSICPKCRKRSGHELLAGHLNKVNDFLRARGIKHAIFADKLINSLETKVKRTKEWGTGRMIPWGGCERLLDDAAGSYVQKATWQAIDKIPDDIVMLDWYHMLAPDTERYFAKHGKEVVFANFEPFSFARYQQRLYAPNVRGGEISTWIENGQMSHAHENWPLLAAMTADMLWSDVYRKTPLLQRMDVFSEFWKRNRDLLNNSEDRLPTRKPGGLRYKSVDIGSQDEPMDVTPLLSATPEGYHVPFKIAKRPIVIRPEDSQGHTIPIGRKARSIVFLYGVLVQAKEVRLPALYDYNDYNEYYLSREIGAMQVRADFPVKNLRHPVREGRVPLRLGFEIGSLSEPYGVTAISRPTFCDGFKLSNGNAVYAYEWVNPNPENMVILDITLGRGRARIPSDIHLYAVTVVL